MLLSLLDLQLLFKISYHVLLNFRNTLETRIVPEKFVSSLLSFDRVNQVIHLSINSVKFYGFHGKCLIQIVLGNLKSQ